MQIRHRAPELKLWTDSMVEVAQNINIFMENLESLEKLSRECLQCCFLWPYQVICHHFSYILFTAMLLESANIEFSKRLLSAFLGSSTIVSRADSASCWRNVMNRKVSLLWLHASSCPAHTPPLSSRLIFKIVFVTFFCSLLPWPLPHSTKVWGCGLGEEVTSWAGWMLILLITPWHCRCQGRKISLGQFCSNSSTEPSLISSALQLKDCPNQHNSWICSNCE